MEVLPEVSPEAILAFSPTLMVPLVAGIVQIFTHTGMPTRLASLTSLVLGVVFGIVVASITGAVLFLGFVQGATVGVAAAGLWLNLSPKVNTNGS